MKFKIMLLNIILSFALLSFSSCSIEGEQICGTWNADGDYGKMQVEITPWKGKFLGYLMAYQNGSETITGSKTEDFIFITDLTFKENKYVDGKIYLDPNSESYCGLALQLIDKNQLKASYNCEGQTVEETWYRKGFDAPETTAQPTKAADVKATEDNTADVATNLKEKDKVVPVTKSQKTNDPFIKAKQPTKPEIEGETKKASSFNIIGLQDIVKYDDYKTMEKVIEAMWTKIYNDDFSGKLKNITEVNNVYVSYSNYDQPKGKMTITLGYKVADLSNIPSNLKGVKIPSNDYLVYPMSGDKSDYEGEGWEQMGELMMYRKGDSADYEVYTFDNSYNITKAEMWIATK